MMIKMRRTRGLVLIGLFVVIGIVLTVYGIVQLKEYNTQMDTYVPTTGIVVNYEKRTSSSNDINSDTTYAIIVEYTVEGRNYTVTSSVSSTSPEKIGTEIELRYNPDKPEDAIIVKNSPKMILIIGIAWSVLCGGVFFVEFAKFKRAYANDEE